ncbi:DNA helicase UvrD [Sulfobacillus sp. hq2]|nr:DNA helicase UvrD [Sulfobacillus sp. hq2]
MDIMGGSTRVSQAQRPRVVDQETRDRIITDFRHNIVVEAGAGTGKTTLMVARTVYAVVHQRMSLDRIALITFMEKAADEIRSRLAMRLEDVIREGDPLEAALAQRALEQLPGAAITTIHGFAMRTLQRMGPRAAVPLNFRVMDPYEQDELFDQAFRAWLASDGTAAECTRTILGLGLPFERFHTMAKMLSQEPDIPSYSATKPGLDWVDELLATGEKWMQRAQDLAAEDDQGRLQIYDIVRFMRSLKTLDRAAWYKALASWQVGAPKGNRKKWAEASALAEQKEWVADLKESLAAFRQHLADYLLAEFLSLMTQGFLPFWKDFRWQRGQLTFDDLLWEARHVLRRGRGEERDYDMIMVDEFQDTDAVQAEIIIRTLNPSWQGDWTKAPVPAGSLFVVGDPKQSIYRFRGASVETYQMVRAQLQQQGALLLDIVQNFRSRPEIIEPVNTLFTENWPQQLDPARPYVAPYTPLVPYMPADEAPRFIVQGGPTDGSAYDERLFQARLIAEWLKQWVVSEKLAILDPQNGATRMATLGDVALLIPNRTGMSIYQDVLTQAGLAVAPEGGIRFFERDEVRGFQQFLSALRKPQAVLPIVAWLSSPWVGISHRELAQHRRLGGTFAYLEANAQGHPAVLRALAQLRNWHQQWWAWRAEDFFWALYDWSGLPAALSARQDAGALANLEKLADLSRDLGDLWGIDKLCQWLERKVQLRDKEEEGPLPTENDAVHIFTVHRAKGLEWPIVIVANWHSRPRATHPGLRLSQGRIALASKDLLSRDWEALEQEERVRQDAERERLYYVALTRARDYLVVIDTYAPDKSNAWNLYPRWGASKH